MKNLLIITILIILSFGKLFSQKQNVSINNTGVLPDASAMLDIAATDKGLLIPRMNSGQRQAIVAPATGLLVYDTGTDSFWYYNGTQWTTISGGSGGGTISGFSWNNSSDLLRITENGIDWDVTIDNEADDLSDNFINDLSNVNANPSNGDFLQWNGSQWVAAASSSSCTTLNEAYNCGGAGTGRVITANAGSVEIISNQTKPLLVTASGANTIGISAEHSNSGVAIAAGNTSSGTQYSTIQSTTSATSNVVSAVLGSSTSGAWGVSGQIEAVGTAESGIYGTNLRTNGGHGVLGIGYNGTVGKSTKVDGYGVSGWNTAASDPGIGVYGQGITGIAGQSLNTSLSYGVYSYDDGGIYRNLDVGQNFSAGGTKSFRIDNPSDPDNKFLVHFCVESPEVLNIYRGTAILNNNGEANVKLPEYFSDINRKFSYNLTAVGQPAPNIYIKEKIKNGKFIIAGGNKNQEIDWIVYAERNDKYLQQNPDVRETQPLKTGKYKNKYVHPEAWGKSKSKNILFKPSMKLKGETNNKQPKLNILD